MSKSNQSGFSVVEILLGLVIVGIIGGAGWYVWQSNNKADSSSKQPPSSEKTADTAEESSSEAETISTDDWVSYSNKEGEFSFKHPKSWVSASKPELCSEGLALFGADAKSVGICASESGGQMLFFSLAGNQDDEVLLKDTDYSGLKSSLIAINGIQGSRQEGLAKDQVSEEGPGGLADGTKVVQYVFVANNDKTYVAKYVQQAGYPDALAEFDVLVSDTFKFTP